ncbi:MAG: preprotein translocase subunit YajC [Ignavibacteriae bacterium]|nr:preprotein translocase subunit YajC [Ignavibacteriota bacterium]MCC7094161.1 preprotein translocase subunit YajC [Ignavibacteriaceae bacterium]MCE7857032.1 preprotein translocase subunit YajC [Ignavibacteria bacterium CHB3]MCL4279695.1 preprotein translocase subunit YajC [Ignavibacteriaceae bacterium]MCZ7613379.1 preprotein translocase subunit YajC [Ignavibacteriaceae bacterium]
MNQLLIAMAPQGGEGGGGLVSTLIMFGAIFLIFYFMIIRPQQKRAKERDKLLSNLEKGDKVVTNGGIHGIISGLEEKTALLQISENTKIKIERSAITTVLPK